MIVMFCADESKEKKVACQFDQQLVLAIELKTGVLMAKYIRSAWPFACLHAGLTVQPAGLTKVLLFEFIFILCFVFVCVCFYLSLMLYMPVFYVFPMLYIAILFINFIICW